jgi:predicted membrane metal-binding protein
MNSRGRTGYDQAMKRLRSCILGLSAVLLALVARAVIAGADLPVALAVTITGLLLVAACWLRRYGIGMSDVIDPDDRSKGPHAP